MKLLAQCLVGLEKFPGCKFLKWKDRGHVLMQELLHYAPDVACLQVQGTRIYELVPPTELL